MTEPTLRLLSCGAGVQSTTLVVLMLDGRLPKVDAALFADTGWEPATTYRQVDRIEAALAEADVPLVRVSNGNLRAAAVDPESRFASIPYHVLGAPYEITVPTEFGPCPDCTGAPRADCAQCKGSGTVATAWGTRPATEAERSGIGRRQCTSEYKLAPINREVRRMLGAKPPNYRTVPRGQFAEQWIGFSTDEVQRAGPRGDEVRYQRPRYPLLELGMSRRDCVAYLERRGWGATAKSACIGCPYHGNRQWRALRDTCSCEHHVTQHIATPDGAACAVPDCPCARFDNPEWRDAVEFDGQIRKGGARGKPLNGEAFLSRTLRPLDIAPIDHVTRGEIRDMADERQGDLFTDLAESGDPDGCSPYGCRSGLPADDHLNPERSE